MFRTRTTLVIGAGSGFELELPDGREVLHKIGQAYDFQRLGTDVQTRDMVLLAQHFEKFARQMGASKEKLQEAASVISAAARVSNSLEEILEQHAHDPMIQAAGKLAIVYFVLQSEARSPLGKEPRIEGDLPLRGDENWLFQLSRMIISGVPRNKIDQSFNNLSIINFSYDRSLQNYLPWVISMAYGMPLHDARDLVDAKLNIIHPLGNVGRLPWERGESPDVEWGNEEPWNIHSLIKEVKTVSEVMSQPQFKQHLISEVAGGKRIVFLGFGFEPHATSMLFDYSLSHDPDILVAGSGLNESGRRTVHRTLKRMAGTEDDDLISIQSLKPYQLLRENSLFLES